jgi:hypothetical protein
MHQLSVGWSNADEVTEERNENNRFSNHGEKEDLLALLCIDILINGTHSVVEVVFLVDSNEVDDIPNAKEENWYQSQDLWCVEHSSCSFGVICEPWDNEAWSYQQWKEAEYADHGVPPMKIFIHEAEEIPKEKDDCNSECDNTDWNSTALNWHANAASISLSESISANAITAAAFF